jgi:hypothetical protein
MPDHDIPDHDIFDEDGALSRAFLISRGYCCGNGCRNCPYFPRYGGLNAELPEDTGAADRPPSSMAGTQGRRSAEPGDNYPIP